MARRKIRIDESLCSGSWSSQNRCCALTYVATTLLGTMKNRLIVEVFDPGEEQFAVPTGELGDVSHPLVV